MKKLIIELEIQNITHPGFQESYDAIYCIPPQDDAEKMERYQAQYEEFIQAKATASMSSIANFAGRKYGPEKAVNQDTSTNLPHFPDDFHWLFGGSSPNGYQCMNFGQRGIWYLQDNYLCWRRYKENPQIYFYQSNHNDPQVDLIYRSGFCSFVHPQGNVNVQVCIPKNSPYFIQFENSGKQRYDIQDREREIFGEELVKCMSVMDQHPYENDYLCNTGNGLLQGSVTSLSAKR